MGAHRVGRAGAARLRRRLVVRRGSADAGLNGVTIGALLLGWRFAVGAIQLGLARRTPHHRADAVLLSLAFFILPTRVHERYLFPVFVFLPLVAVNRDAAGCRPLVLAIGAFINLHGVLTVRYYGTANVTGLPFGADMRSFGWVLLSVVLQTGGFLVVAWSLRPVSDLVAGPLRRLAGLGGRPPEVDPYDLPPPRTATRSGAPGGGRSRRPCPGRAGACREPSWPARCGATAAANCVASPSAGPTAWTGSWSWS